MALLTKVGSSCDMGVGTRSFACRRVGGCEMVAPGEEGQERGGRGRGEGEGEGEGSSEDLRERGAEEV